MHTISRLIVVVAVVSCAPPALADSLIDVDTTWSSDQVIAGTLTIAPGVTVTVQGNVQVTADALVISEGARVTASGLGYGSTLGPGAGISDGDDGGSGGGHGGAGARGSGSTLVNPGARNDAPLAPVEMGSGGGNGCGGTVGGAGGGALRFVVVGACAVDGVVDADGAAGSANGNCGGGGGAGGTLSFTCASFDLGGALSAEGGAGGAAGKSDGGGGGAGGRVLVRAEALLDLTAEALHVDGAGDAGTGSVALHHPGSDALEVVHGFDVRAADAPHQFGSFTATDADVLVEGLIPTLTAGSIVLERSTLRASGDLLLDAGAGLVALRQSSVRAARLDVHAGDVVIDLGSLVDTSGLGWGASQGPGAGAANTLGGGGGAHGGRGGQGNTNNGGAAGGAAYDLPLLPREPGSGGGTGNNGNAVGGAGGGVIVILASGTIILDGSLSANGNNGALSGDRGGGGGAGGSLYLEAVTLSGGGTLDASGGRGGPQSWQGGGGGGGRVAVLADDLEGFSLPSPQSVAGGVGHVSGAPGTLALYDRDDDVLTVRGGFDLVAADAPHQYAALDVNGELRTAGADTLTVSGDARLSGSVDAATAFTLAVGGHLDLVGATLGGESLTLLAASAAIDQASSLDVSGRGYAAGAGPGAGESPNTSESAGGGGHGGRGGSGVAGGAGGGRYDDAFAPSEAGSGGGHGRSSTAPGGRGGGVIRVDVSGALVFDGAAFAHGSAGASVGNRGGGGGAGGAIWISASTLSGRGHARADGGLGGSSSDRPGGAGAGGRVAFVYGSGGLVQPRTSWALTQSQAAGEDGSVVFWRTSTDDLFVVSGLDLDEGAADLQFHDVTLYEASLRLTGQSAGIALSASGDFAATNASVAVAGAATLDVEGSTRFVAGGAVGGDLSLSTTDFSASGASFRLALFDVAGSTITLDAATVVDGSARGYGSGEGPAAGTDAGDRGGGGGGHGGPGGSGEQGGSGALGVGGAIVGSAYEPVAKGSGGGSGRNGQIAGASGGGAVRLVASGRIVVDGLIRVNGGNGGEVSNRGGGGGAGGSITLKAPAVQGLMTLEAEGGRGGGCCSVGAGGGGGGRIHVQADVVEVPRKILWSAAGGGGLAAGGVGTAAILRPAAGTLEVLEGWLFDAAHANAAAGSSYEYTNVHVHAGAVVRAADGITALDAGTLVDEGGVWRHGAAFTLSADELVFEGADLLAESSLSLLASERISLAGTTLRSANLHVSAPVVALDLHSVLDVSARGFGAEQGPGAATHGGDRGGPGAGHGGAGGRSETGGSGPLGAPGVVYGDSLAPATAGSGGGSVDVSNNPSLLTRGGAGGGVIRVEAATSLSHDGELRANGGNGEVRSNRSGGGGAGGSIWVTAGHLEGGGRFVAEGGQSPGCCSVQGGGGGGGRVLVEFDDGGVHDPSVSSVRGGAGFDVGESGSLLFINRALNDGTVVGGLDLAADTAFRSLAVLPGGALRFVGATPLTLSVEGALSLDGARLTSTGDLSITAASVSFDGSEAASNGGLIVNAPSGAVSLRASDVAASTLEVRSRSLAIDAGSRLHADARGHLGSSGEAPGESASADCGGGGGGHGGHGGRGLINCVRAGGVENGDPWSPSAMGSGGGAAWNGAAAGGRGGGAVHVVVAETLTLQGVISAAGGVGGNSSERGGGGGAGGSVWVETGHLTGSGTVRAPGGRSPGTSRGGGGGGGGRVAVYFDTSNFVGVTRTDVGGGSSHSEAGQAGSAIFVDRTTGDLSVAGGMTFAAEAGPFSFRDVVSHAGSLIRATGESVLLEARGALLLDATRLSASDGLELLADSLSLEAGSVVSGRSLKVSGKDVYVSLDSVLSADAGGFAASSGPGAGANETSDHGGGGAGHGGPGGRGSNNAAGGVRYGADALDELEPGSGGGNGWGGTVAGGAGGGVVRVYASETMTLDGVVRANGAGGGNNSSRGGGGGAGGSVRVEARSFDGVGSLQARGGPGGGSSNRMGGGGGGGRVALCYLQGRRDALAAVDVAGGGGHTAGEGGTLFVDEDCNRAPEPLSASIEIDGVSQPAGVTVPAGWPLAFVVRVLDENGPADIEEVRLTPLGSAGPTFTWRRATATFSAQGDESAIALDASESGATLDGAGFEVRFSASPSFAFPAGEAMPGISVEDRAGFSSSAAGDAARYAVATALRVSQRSFVSGARELAPNDWLTAAAELRVLGRVTYAGVNRGPPSAAGIEVLVRDAADAVVGQGALGDGGDFDLALEAPSGDVTLTVALASESLPSGASEVEPTSGVPLRIDGAAPTVSSVALDPPRLSATYVGPVRFVLTLSDADSGVGQASQRIDVKLGSGAFDGDELMSPIGAGQFAYVLGDRSFAPYSGERLAYRVTASDVAGNSVVVEGDAVVEPSNEAPAVSSTPPPTASEGQPWTWTVAASDPEGDPLRYLLVQSPAGMQASAAGEVRWVPAYDQLGEQSATLRVLDALGAYSDVSFTIMVSALDEDGDGMADTWERLMGLNPQADDALGDADGDGRTNVSEFTEGTDPISNRAPGAPVALAPVAGITVDAARPVLQLGSASDPEGDVLSYRVELYADAALTTLLGAGDGLIDDGERVRFVPEHDLPEDSVVYWRGRAFDGVKGGPYSDVASFRVDAANGAPGVPRPLSPLDGGVLSATSASLITSVAFDPEGDTLRYEVEVYDDEALTHLVSAAEASQQGGEPRLVVDGLTHGLTYRWRARALDEGGAAGPWSEVASFSVQLGGSNAAPSAPVLVSPAGGELVVAAEAPLVLENAADADGDRLSYTFELDTHECFCSPALVVVREVAEAASGLTRIFATSLEHARTYHWRARAEDGRAAGAFSVASFRTLLENQAPSVPRVQAPADGGEGAPEGQAFVWVRSVDPEGGEVRYDVELLDVSAGEVGTVAVVGGTEGGSDVLARWEPGALLTPGHVYAWRLRAVDALGAASDFSPAAAFTLYAPSTRNRAPEGLALLSPVDGALVATKVPTLEVRNAVDADGEALRYTFELYRDGELSDLVLASEVAEGAGGATRLRLTEPLEEGGTYYWRARVSDGFAPSAFTPSERFTVRLFVATPDEEPSDGGVLVPADGGDEDPPVQGCPCTQAGRGGVDLSLLALLGLLSALSRRRRS